MARWEPSNKVDSNEHIGRRLFDEPKLVGAGDQKPFAGLLLTHFEETRDAEYSLDRMGRSSIDPKVVAYLRPRAEAAGGTYRKPKGFQGWAVLRARELINAKKDPKLEVHASPETGAAPKDNLYHAHVVRPATLEPYMMALHLKYLFETYGTVEAVSTQPQSTRANWLEKLVKWIRSAINAIG